VERLGVRLMPEDLLGLALTHASYLNETNADAASNERLEFLGDAVLGFVIGHELFRLFPEAGEGVLTRMRADLVRGRALASAANRLGLGDYMILGRGEEAAGGRTREKNLAGTLEALIGAVYRARGYRSARSFILRILGPELELVRREGATIDAKSNLQHLVQARWHEPPEYVTLEGDPGGVGRQFTVAVKVGGVALGQGSGPSKREAQQQAAREAVARLVAEAGSEVARVP
jgi:ribonuclease-3